MVLLDISNAHPTQGLTCPDREEAMVKRIMIEFARKRLILVDGQKLNTAETYHVASLGDIDYLITEDIKLAYIKEHWPKYSYRII